MNFEEYRSYDGLGLAGLVKGKEVTPEELLRVAIQRSEEVNPTINAINLPLYDYAAQACKEVDLDSVFAGVPFLLKDTICDLEGVPTSSGSTALRGFTASEDSELVKRFKQAGLVIFGKTNMPEFGMLPVTEPEAFGISRNPWDLNRTPGGSSGGAAAAVAAGILPMASASDGAGSIRVPAACCGLVGLKPSRGRVSAGRAHGEIWGGTAIEHIVCRSVRDTAAMLDSICGSVPGDPYFIKKPSICYSDQLRPEPSRLKIAYNFKSPIGTPVDVESKKSLFDAVRKLEDLGHVLVEDSPAIDAEEYTNSFLCLMFSHISAFARELESSYGKSIVRSALEPSTRMVAAMGDSISASNYLLARSRLNKFSRITADFHTKYDCYLTPVLGRPPVEIGATKPTAIEAMAMKMVDSLKLGRVVLNSEYVSERSRMEMGFVPFTGLANLTGQPAISLPLYWTKDNLPLGVQLVGPADGEALLLRLAKQVEEAFPWKERIAPL